VKYVRPRAERRGPKGRASASRRRDVGTRPEEPSFGDPQARRRVEARRAEIQRRRRRRRFMKMLLCEINDVRTRILFKFGENF